MFLQRPFRVLLYHSILQGFNAAGPGVQLTRILASHGASLGRPITALS
jgi:hypothetical protein